MSAIRKRRWIENFVGGIFVGLGLMLSAFILWYHRETLLPEFFSNTPLPSIGQPVQAKVVTAQDLQKRLDTIEAKKRAIEEAHLAKIRAEQEAKRRAAEEKRRAEEAAKRKAVEEKRRAEEAKRKTEEAQKKAAEEKRKAEEAKKKGRNG